MMVPNVCGRKDIARSLAAVFVVVIPVMVGGCNTPPPVWMPDPLGVFPPRTDTLPGVVTPSQRAEQLRSLGRGASKQRPEQQEEIARYLLDWFGRESDPLLRFEMVRAAGVCRAESARLLVAAALNDADTDVRVAACEVLGGWGGAESASQLQAVLAGDPDLQVRLAAARALGQSSTESAVASLAQALEDRDPAMQYQAVRSLERLTGQRFGNDVNQWRQFVQSRVPESPQPQSLAERTGRTY